MASRDLGQLVLDRGARVSLARGATLFHEGEPGTSVYACRSGRLKVTVTPPTGGELVLGWKEPGDGFGELSAIDGAPRSARIVAETDSELAVLGRADFLDALRSSPDVAVAVLVDLSGHLRRANARVAAYNSERIPARVGHRLIELVAMVRRHGGGTGPVELRITQDDLAGWVGATRESTARALADLRRRGVVETGRSRITVLDPGGLEAAVAASGR